jgi:cytidylate kinase
MNTTFGVNQCLSFINSQLQSRKPAQAGGPDSIKCVTVSRQSGCGAHVFAEELAAWLQAHLPHGPVPWTIFDGTLVEAVLQDHHLPARLAAFMPEDRILQLDDIVQDLLSLHPPSETLVRQTAETILRLAELGNVIIVGRGSNVITASLPRVLRVRLIGSVEQRVKYMQEFDKLSKRDALARMEREDAGRARYLKRYFGKDIDNPYHHHLIINTDCTTLREAAEIVGTLALRRSRPAAATSVKAAA